MKIDDLKNGLDVKAANLFEEHEKAFKRVKGANRSAVQGKDDLSMAAYLAEVQDAAFNLSWSCTEIADVLGMRSNGAADRQRIRESLDKLETLFRPVREMVHKAKKDG